MKTYEKVYNLVQKIPKGKVATYGQIGQLLDLNARVVGWALNRLARIRKDKCNFRVSNPEFRIKKNIQNSKLETRNPKPENVPWQRVINSKGGISTNKLLNIPLGLQRKLLENEGIKFNNHEKVDLKKYIWKAKP